MRKPPLPERSAPSTRSLADVYLDGRRVQLMGDPAPRVAKILAVGGRPAQGLQVRQGRSADDRHGRPLQADDLVDRRAEPTTPIFLTSSPAADRPAQADARPVPPVVVELPDDGGGPPLRGPLPRGLDPGADGSRPYNPMPEEGRSGPP